MNKMIVLDIDGTIMHHGHVSKRVIKALKFAQEKGLTVTLASGRNSNGIKKIAKKLGINDGKTPIIGLNGAEIFTLSKKNKATHLWEKTFTKDITETVVKSARANGVTLFAYTTNDKLFYQTGKNAFFLMFMGLRTMTWLSWTPYMKKDLSNIKYSLIKFVAFGSKLKVAAMKEDFKDLNLSTFAWSYISDSKGNIEINMPNVNKVEALKYISNDLNIKPEEVIYFGDGENDILSLEWAGTGVVMRNAKSEVKKHANELTLSCKDDGVADWIEKNIK